jgi:putative redox protein
MKTSQTRLVWCGEGTFIGIDSGKHSVVISTQGDDAVGMKPSDLVLVALASCTAVDVTSILKKKRQQVAGLEIIAEGTQDEDPPWTFREIHLTYRVRGKGIDPKAVERSIELAEGKYCSVAASLRPQVGISWHCECLDEPGETRADGGDVPA